MSSLPKAVALAPFLVAAFFLQDAVRLTVQDAVGIWSHAAVSEHACGADALLVMGAAQYDGEPSPAFRRRLDLAARLHGDGCAPRIVVSGGSRDGDRFSEGEAGVAYLAGLGLPRDVLFAETEAATSYENIRNSIPLLAGRRVLIVTDDMHAFRSRWLANELGLEADVAAVPTSGSRLSYGSRELVGLLAYQSGILP